jgi:hypothetical protein
VEVWIEEAVQFAEGSSEPLPVSVSEHVY